MTGWTFCASLSCSWALSVGTTSGVTSTVAVMGSPLQAALMVWVPRGIQTIEAVGVGVVGMLFAVKLFVIHIKLLELLVKLFVCTFKTVVNFV